MTPETTKLLANKFEEVVKTIKEALTNEPNFKVEEKINCIVFSFGGYTFQFHGRIYTKHNTCFFVTFMINPDKKEDAEKVHDLIFSTSDYVHQDGKNYIFAVNGGEITLQQAVTTYLHRLYRYIGEQLPSDEVKEYLEKPRSY